MDAQSHVITNGFDPEELHGVQPHAFGHPAIVYAGTFYPPRRVITPVMQALRALHDAAPARADWRFHYYGVHGDHVQAEAEHARIRERVELHGRVTRQEALSAVAGSSLVLVLTTRLADTPGGPVVTDIPGKLFEALGLGVPILMVGACGNELRDMIETAGTVRHVPAEDRDGIARALEALLWGPRPEPRKPDAYAWPTVIRRLDGVLRRAIQERPSGRVAHAR
jgi:glycosyltransferase involved in cell wall biosynthesis